MKPPERSAKLPYRERRKQTPVSRLGVVENNYSNPKHQSEEVVNPIGGKGDGAVKKKANAAVEAKHLPPGKDKSCVSGKTISSQALLWWEDASNCLLRASREKLLPWHLLFIPGSSPPTRFCASVRACMHWHVPV